MKLGLQQLRVPAPILYRRIANADCNYSNAAFAALLCRYLFSQPAKTICIAVGVFSTAIVKELNMY